MILAMHPILMALIPELLLVVGGSLVILMGLSPVMRRHCITIGLISLLGALYAAWLLEHSEVPQAAVPELAESSLVWFVRWVTFAVGGLILLISQHVPDESERGEFIGLALFSLCGISLVALADNLILLFLALELVSVPTYILVGLSRKNIRAQEAAGKYFFLGAFAAALTLYGFSFLYGATGTMRMFHGKDSIFAALSATGALSDSFVQLGLLLSLAGLAFKIAAVPFHFYVADVYQGAASPVTGMLGFVPKFAGFLALIHVFSLTSWQFNGKIFWLLWAMAAATMVVGNTLALMQHNVKRMLAYSSVAHSGYMLVALVAGPNLASAYAEGPLRDGPTALLFYMAVYGVMNLGAFAALSFFCKQGEDEEESAETLDDLAGASRRHPWASIALAVCVLGLMGFPATAGFVAKIYIFSSAVSAYAGTSMHTAMMALVVLGVLNSAVGAAYYLRIISTCYLRKPAEGITPLPGRHLVVGLTVCVIVVLAVFVRPEVLFRESRNATERMPRPIQSWADGEIDAPNVPRRSCPGGNSGPCTSERQFHLRWLFRLESPHAHGLSALIQARILAQNLDQFRENVTCTWNQGIATLVSFR